MQVLYGMAKTTCLQQDFDQVYMYLFVSSLTFFNMFCSVQSLKRILLGRFVFIILSKLWYSCSWRKISNVIVYKIIFICYYLLTSCYSYPVPLFHCVRFSAVFYSIYFKGFLIRSQVQRNVRVFGYTLLYASLLCIQHALRKE